MADLNSVSLVGRLTKDAELKSLTNTELVTFTMASETGWGDRAMTMFIQCKYFGKGAVAIHHYLTKGKQVGVNGELCVETWDDKETGVKRSKPVIVIRNVQLLASPQVKKEPEETPKRNVSDEDWKLIPF